jgi:hypothetical protein
MSRPFTNYTAKPTFAQFKEPGDASDYITKKKIKYSFCSPNYCKSNKNIYSESNYLMLKRANKLAFYPNKYSLNKSQLYMNLLTQLDLNSEIAVISDLSGNTFPVNIDTTLIPYLKYNIDPSGNIFGNNVCGLDNWENYLIPNTTTNNS